MQWISTQCDALDSPSQPITYPSCSAVNLHTVWCTRFPSKPITYPSCSALNLHALWCSSFPSQPKTYLSFIYSSVQSVNAGDWLVIWLNTTGLFFLTKSSQNNCGSRASLYCFTLLSGLRCQPAVKKHLQLVTSYSNCIIQINYYLSVERKLALV